MACMEPNSWWMVVCEASGGSPRGAMGPRVVPGHEPARDTARGEGGCMSARQDTAKFL